MFSPNKNSWPRHYKADMVVLEITKVPGSFCLFDSSNFSHDLYSHGLKKAFTSKNTVSTFQEEKVQHKGPKAYTS